MTPQPPPLPQVDREELRKQIPVYEVVVRTINNGLVKVLTLEPGEHHVESLHGTRGYYEKDKPVGFITLEGKNV